MIGLQKSFYGRQLVETTKFYLELPRLRFGYEIHCSKAHLNNGIQGKLLFRKFSACSFMKSNCSVSFRLSSSVDSQALHKDIIRFIKPIICTKKTDSFDIKHRSVVILATPSCIEWLENENIRNYFKNLVKDCIDPSMYEVNVICACVDGLAPSIRELDHGQGKEIYEGISILWGTSIINNSELWSSLPPRLAKSNEQSCIIIQHRLGDKKNPLLQVTVPLANTIFKNGRRSTLSVSKWQISSRGVEMVQNPAYRICVSICNFTNDEEIFIKIPAKTLTAPRKIEKGFGNIVRRLKIEGSGSIPASYELEKAVMETHKLKTSNQCHKIWALIIPANFRNEKIDNPFCLDSLGNQELDSSYIENAIRRGAKLYQVLSGGGGWGSKEGLLALDPNSVQEDSNVTQVEMNPDKMFTYEPHLETLVNIAENDSIIQFVRTNEEYKSKPSPTKNHFTNNQIMLGTYDNIAKPSTVDFTAHLSIPGLFGCVSESGIFLHSTMTGSTKINIPYSYIYAPCHQIRDRHYSSNSSTD